MPIEITLPRAARYSLKSSDGKDAFIGRLCFRNVAGLTGKRLGGFVLVMADPAGVMHELLVVFWRVDDRFNRRMAFIARRFALVDMLLVIEHNLGRTALADLLRCFDPDDVLRDRVLRQSDGNAQSGEPGNGDP